MPAPPKYVNQIYEWLSKRQIGDEFTAFDIAKDLGLHNLDVSGSLGNLRDRKWISTHGLRRPQVYTLTQLGKAEIDFKQRG